MDARYIRVATMLYKIVQRPLQSGDTVEVRIAWNSETLRQDHSKDIYSQIEKYDGFCCIPSHTDYHKVVGTFLNEYQPIDIQPQQGDFPTIHGFMQHIFGEQIEMGYDYLQLLYTKPLQRLPILLLVSRERNTGKATFLNLLKLIFGGNMTFNTNEDFRSQFNSDWATKLIVAVDEVLLDRREDSERIKNLSTARSYKAEAKGKDRRDVEFFAKFVLCSNNELNPIFVEQGETRYWVRKIPVIKSDNVNILQQMQKELPSLLWNLAHRKLSTRGESRMWFRHDLLITDALRRMVRHNRGKCEQEMLQVVMDVMELMQLEEYLFCVVDMAANLETRGIKVEHSVIRKIIQDNWELKSSKPRHYDAVMLTPDGRVEKQQKIGRCYKITKGDRERIL